MDSDFQLNGIDWTAKGYFGVPSPPKLPGNLAQDPWLLWTVACHRAKQGDFALLPSLIPLCKQVQDPVLAQSASYLLGDAGTSDCFLIMAQELDRVERVETVLEYCRALHFQGKLANVPVILRAYERIATDGDADIVPVWLSNLLESEDGVLSESIQFEDLKGYVEAVNARFKELTDELGTDQLLVFRGEQYGVQRLARYILRRVQKPFVRAELRQRFEAATGIDCTKFYKKGELQPLAAAAIIENFLESPHAAKFEDGVRYFFGHRIPD